MNLPQAEFEGSPILESIVERLKRNFDLEGLGTFLGIFATANEDGVSVDSLEILTKRLLTFANCLIGPEEIRGHQDLFAYLNREGYGDIVTKVIAYCHRFVKKKLRSLDNVLVNVDGDRKFGELRLHSYLEHLLLLNLELRKAKDGGSHDNSEAQPFYYAALFSAATQIPTAKTPIAKSKLKKVARNNNLLAQRPELDPSSFDVTLIKKIALEHNFTPGSDEDQYLSLIRHINYQGLTKLLIQVSGFDEDFAQNEESEAVSSEPKKLSSKIEGALRLLKKLLKDELDTLVAIQDLGGEANYPNKEGLRQLLVVLEEILTRNDLIPNEGDAVDDELKNKFAQINLLQLAKQDPVLAGWRLATDSIRVDGVPAKAYLQQQRRLADMRSSGGATQSGGDSEDSSLVVTNLTSIRDELSAQKLVFQEFKDLYPNRWILIESYIRGLETEVDELLASLEVVAEKTPAKYLEAFLDFMAWAQGDKPGSSVTPRVITGADQGGWPDGMKEAYKKYSSLAPTEEEKKHNLEWAHIDKVVKNIAKSWEYQALCIQGGAAQGLVHRVDEIDTYVDPFRWRDIFAEYGLVSFRDRLNKKSEKESNGELKGPFWDMWRMAVKAATNPSNEIVPNDMFAGSDGRSEKDLFLYPDDFAANFDGFYNYIFEKYLQTERGQNFQKLLRDKYKGDFDVNWQAMRVQVFAMFNIGNIHDEIYATLAVKGSSLAHSASMVQIDKATLPLWQCVYPVHYALYLANNPAKIGPHETVNFAICTEEALLGLYKKIGKKEFTDRTRFLLELTRAYVNLFADPSELLGKIENPSSFPNFARSILGFGLSSTPSRYFETDLVGWARMWGQLWEGVGTRSLGIEGIKSLIEDFPKKTIGFAKLVKEAIPLGDFGDLFRMRVWTLMLQQEDRSFVNEGRLKISRLLSGALIPNAPQQVIDAFYEITNSIIGASTAKYLGFEEGDVDGEFAAKQMLVGVFGAELDKKDGKIKLRHFPNNIPKIFLMRRRRGELNKYMELIQSRKQLKTPINIAKGAIEWVNRTILMKDPPVKDAPPPFAVVEKKEE